MKKVLVIHTDDRSTDMLKAVYEGKGYDVINDPGISDEDVVEQIKSHDKIIMLDMVPHMDSLLGIGTLERSDISSMTLMQTCSRQRRPIRCGVIGTNSLKPTV